MLWLASHVSRAQPGGEARPKLRDAVVSVHYIPAEVRGPSPVLTECVPLYQKGAEDQNSAAVVQALCYYGAKSRLNPPSASRILQETHETVLIDQNRHRSANAVMTFGTGMRYQRTVVSARQACLMSLATD